MNANTRIAALEKKVQALTMAIDAQNVTIAELGARIEALKPVRHPQSGRRLPAGVRPLAGESAVRRAVLLILAYTARNWRMRLRLLARDPLVRRSLLHELVLSETE